jgi:hypothetical protein
MHTFDDVSLSARSGFVSNQRVDRHRGVTTVVKTTGNVVKIVVNRGEEATFGATRGTARTADDRGVTGVTARLPGDRHGSSMSGNVINLRAARPVRREVEAANDERTDLGPSVDLAVWLHDIIIDGVRSGQFSGHEHGPAAALADLLSHIQGGDLLEIAQWHFERLYGSDPYAFVSRLTVAMQGGSRKP